MSRKTLDEFSPVISEVLARGGTVRLNPKGSSMRFFIREGRDEVVLRGLQAPVRKDGVYLYRRANGMLVLHRCIRAGNDLIFRGDNQAEKEYGVTRDQVIGEVIQVIRGRTVINAGGWIDKLFARSAYPVFCLKKAVKNILLLNRK